MTATGPQMANTPPGEDPQLIPFLASALFVVPWFAWQAWVLGDSYRPWRGNAVVETDASSDATAARIALASQDETESPEMDQTAATIVTTNPTAPELNTPPIAGRGRSLLLVVSMSLLFLFSKAWLARVLAQVPEPYLDEVFHIPQAQMYCAGHLRAWDDKITTPPGLYLVSLLYAPFWASGGGHDGCSIWALRGANSVAIMLVAIVACSCRAEQERQAQLVRTRVLYHATAVRKTPESIFSLHALHTGINVALLPVLFFYSALYYTDVYATLATLLAYRVHLVRRADGLPLQRAGPPAWTGLAMVILGLIALLMRQTNVFWVVAYMGGLDAVQAVKAVRRRNAVALQLLRTAHEAHCSDSRALSWTPAAVTWRFYTQQYALGAIHDPPVGDAWPDDWLMTAVSVSVAAVCNPGAILLYVWPSVIILAAFTGFAAWNGGVVLGDKANHLATVHLAQLLYLWPLFVFFSAPLFVTQLLRRAATAGKKHCGFDSMIAAVAKKPYLPLYWLTVGAGMAIVVRYNTIVHPFTLADNRHYMFYVFRYTIRRSAALRYALVPVYATCAWLCWSVLSTDSVTPVRDSHNDRRFVNSPFVPMASIVPDKKAKEETKEQPETSDGAPVAKATGTATRVAKRRKMAVAVSVAVDATNDVSALTPPFFLGLLDENELEPGTATPAMVSPATSTALLWLLATILSLVTAPLVEPRYFILPWVFWRLLVPAVPVTMLPPSQTKGSGVLAAIGHKVDGGVVLETLWFVAINAATMVTFLYRPYVWRAEDGSVLDGGRLQRFLW